MFTQGPAKGSSLLFMGMSYGYEQPTGLDKPGFFGLGSVVQGPDAKTCARTYVCV